MTADVNEIKTADYDKINIGDSASVTKTVTQADVTLFAGITGDFNPLHVNAEFAKKTQFGRNLVHGCFSSGLISAALGMKLPGPGALYVSQTSNFRKPVFIGDTLTARVEVIDKFLKKNGTLKFLKL
ncbi:MAG: MaoC family dehydratase, partial [Promethearchaeota archaeon]